MKARREPITPATLCFNADGTPASPLYGDVYHSPAGALEQAREVFLRGNQLPERWVGRDSFTVCETGFGLGNNFLALWQAWKASTQRPRRLHVFSFEAHPCSREDLARALARHTGDARTLAQRLLAAWPPLLPGLHRLEFEGGALTLTLAFGKVAYLARQVDAGADAFFLDGFSPAVNPEMWSRELFGQLVRMANAGATAATWCSAGQVKRDLTSAGFVVKRAPGFGGKWHMLTATLRPGLGRAITASAAREIMVVGGGLAGAGVAHSLALRGHDVTVLDSAFQDGPAATHEGHRTAAMTPALSRDDNPMSRLSRSGILLAQSRWRDLPGVFEQCGSLLRVPTNDVRAWRDAVKQWGFPTDWADWCEASETGPRIGHGLASGGVWLGQGALVRPSRLIPALLAHDRIRVLSVRVQRLNANADGWVALDDGGDVLCAAPLAVLATAADTHALLAGALPGASVPKLAALQRMGGQVAYFRAGAVPDAQAIVAGAGYWLPADGGIHTGGSTYVFDESVSRPTLKGFSAVADKVAKLLETDVASVEGARARPDGWAGWRAASSDHLPIVGPADAANTLWLACAYGSRGLSWMTLAGEVIAARLNNEPIPLERELLQALRPR